MRKILIRLSILALTLSLGIYAISLWSYFNPPYVKGTDKPVPYVVFQDNGISHIIEIGVDADVSREQLCATLAEVADIHQNDPAREYWYWEHMIIRAYFVKGGKRSYFTAGTLYRYIPVRYPVPEKEGRPDQFYTKAWLARLSL